MGEPALMRCGALLLIFAFACATVARADDASTPAYPLPAQEGKPAAKRTAKPAPAKPAAAKTATPIPRPEPKIDKPAAGVVSLKPEAAKPPLDALAAIPADERAAIRSALLWAGDYAEPIAGEDPMLTAIKHFQKRSKEKVTGELTPAERANLVAAAKEHEQQFGWSVVVDPATGVRLGLPIKLVPNARDAAHGTRWSSAHGEVQVESFRIKNADLAALFEQEKKEPPTRKVESSALHPDSFYLSGMQGLKEFSVRAQLRDSEVRGYTVLFDQMMEGIVAPAVAAMASAFAPFPEQGAPFARLVTPVEYGTGIIVGSTGEIVSDRKLTQGCRVIVVKGLGDAERVAEDPDSGLVLLRVYGARRMPPLYLPTAAAKAGDVSLVGMAAPKEQDGHQTLTQIKARLGGGGAIELRDPVPLAGFSGAAALDPSGTFLGMMEMGNAMLASIGSAAPPVRLVPAPTIRAFLEARDVAPAQAPGGDARASVVRVICVRK